MAVLEGGANMADLEALKDERQDLVRGEIGQLGHCIAGAARQVWVLQAGNSHYTVASMLTNWAGNHAHQRHPTQRFEICTTL